MRPLRCIGPSSRQLCPYKKNHQGTETGSKEGWHDTVRTHGELLSQAQGCLKLPEISERPAAKSSSGLSEEIDPARTWTLDVQPPRLWGPIYLCCLKQWVFSTLLGQLSRLEKIPKCFFTQVHEQVSSGQQETEKKEQCGKLLIITNIPSVLWWQITLCYEISLSWCHHLQKCTYMRISIYHSKKCKGTTCTGMSAPQEALAGLASGIKGAQRKTVKIRKDRLRMQPLAGKDPHGFWVEPRTYVDVLYNSHWWLKVREHVSFEPLDVCHCSQDWYL